MLEILVYKPLTYKGTQPVCGRIIAPLSFEQIRIGNDIKQVVDGELIVCGNRNVVEKFTEDLLAMSKMEKLLKGIGIFKDS